MPVYYVWSVIGLMLVLFLSAGVTEVLPTEEYCIRGVFLDKEHSFNVVFGNLTKLLKG